MRTRTDSTAAFTLLEILVALAILAIMMTLLFTMVSSGAKLWETGNKRIEATQAARMGLNTIERDLRQAFAGNVTTYKSDGTALQNSVPFEAIDNPQATLGLDRGNPSNAGGSQQLRAVVSTGDPDDPYREIGLMCIHTGEDDNALEKGRYHLVLKFLPGTPPEGEDEMDYGGFFLQGPGAGSPPVGQDKNFLPLIDNCIRLTFRYYGIEAPQNPDDPDYDPDDEANNPAWRSGWSPNNRLPLGVLVTLTVLDSRTADKLQAATDGAPLSETDITAGIDAAQGRGKAAEGIQRLIAQGSVTMSRFIPLNRN